MKSERFRKFAEGFTELTNSTYLRRKIKCFKNRFNANPIENEYNSDKVKNVNLMIEKLCPLWVPVPPPSSGNEHQDLFLNLPFTYDEVDFAISNLNLSSSAGIDRIDYMIISPLPKLAKMFLLDLYNDIYESRAFQGEWHRYEIFFIPKGDGLKFRSISLAPCLCKVSEKIITYTVCWRMEYHEKFVDTQFGFSKRSRV